MKTNLSWWACAFFLMSFAGNADKDETPLPAQVTKVVLTAQPAEYTGPCPTEIKFRAKIKVSGQGAVIFQILRSDNVPAPAVTMHFTKAETRDTTYLWKPEISFLGWHQLEILEPSKGLKSNKVDLAVTCQ